MSVAAPPETTVLRRRRPIDAPMDPGARYGRLFPELEPLSVDEDALLELGVTGGICDGGTDCATRAAPRAGRCSASSSPTTSRPTAPRSR